MKYYSLNHNATKVSFQEAVIQEQATQYHHKVFTQLFPFGNRGFLEHHVTAEIKTDWKSNTEADQECCYMRTDRKKACMNRQFF